MIKKKPIAMRLHPDMIAKIEAVRSEYEISSRTAFVEEAVDLYILYLLEQDNR